MRRSVLGVGLALLIAGVPAACLDTASLSGGEGDPAVSDAAQNSDSTFADVSSTNDASPTDSGSGAKGCDAQICDDFDLSTTLGSVWTPQVAGGTVTVTAKGLSLPNALDTHVPEGGLTSNAFIQHVFASAANAPSFRLELDLFLASNAATSAEKDLFVIEGDGVDPTFYTLYVGSFSNAWKLAEYAAFADGGILDHSQNLASPPPMGAWTHVVLTCDGSTMAVSFDGTLTATLSNLSPLAMRTGIQRKLQIGWTYVEKPATDLDVLYDNVAFSFSP